MQPDQGVDQRQADAQPAFSPVRLGALLRKQREHPAQRLRRQADAAVADGKQHGRWLQRYPQHDLAARVGVLGGIGHQIGQHLGQAQRVNLQVKGRAVDLHPQPVVFGGDQRRGGFDGGVQQGLQGHALGPQADLAVRDARHVQQIVQQQRHGAGLALEHAVQPRRIARRDVGRAQRLHGGADGRQRAPQLMRQRGHKLVFAAVGVLQRGLQPLDRIDVGAGAKPAQHLALRVTMGHGPGQVPAVYAVFAKHPVLDLMAAHGGH